MEQIYKLLIADDEQIVLDGLRFIIQELYPNIQIVGAVTTGREAIAVALKEAPDLVFMDIKMPGVSGIEAIETIRKVLNETKFVIISAYEQFEYAKEALKMGVSEYILKPVSQEKVAVVIKQLIQEIDDHRHRLDQEMQRKEKFEKVIPILEHGFIYALLMNADYANELKRYQELFDISKEKGYIVVFEFGDSILENQIQNRIGMGLRGQHHYEQVQNAIKYKCKCVVGPMMINRMTVLVFDDDAEHEYEQRIKSMTLVESTLKPLKDEMKSEVYVGIGACYRLDQIKNSLEEALYALNRIVKTVALDGILHVRDVLTKSPDDDYTYVDIKMDEAQLLRFMENGQQETLLVAMSDFFNRIRGKFNDTLVDIENIATELLVMALGIAYQNQLPKGDRGYSDYLSALKRCSSLMEIETLCRNQLLSISQDLQKNREQHTSKIVQQAVTILEGRYNEEISLVEMARLVAVSPQYFSKIFKEEVGVTYVEYIRHKRVEVAKSLLKSGQYSVKEICYQIGYNDPNYFSRVFKKIVGVSPTDY